MGDTTTAMSIGARAGNVRRWAVVHEGRDHLLDLVAPAVRRSTAGAWVLVTVRAALDGVRSGLGRIARIDVMAAEELHGRTAHVFGAVQRLVRTHAADRHAEVLVPAEQPRRLERAWSAPSRICSWPATSSTVPRSRATIDGKWPADAQRKRRLSPDRFWSDRC